MAMNALPWIFGIAAILLLIVVVAMRARAAGAPEVAMPAQWDLQPRPVLSSDERRVFRHLVESLPDHAVLIKLPLVRFCHPTDPKRVQYWFNLLGSTNVHFAVSTFTGRIVAAVDIDGDRLGPLRGQQIKKAVLAACRIRYLRVSPDALPSASDLRQLVGPGAARSERIVVRDAVATVSAPRRPTPKPAAEGHADFADSFFDPSSRYDDFLSSEFDGLATRRAEVTAPLRTGSAA